MLAIVDGACFASLVLVEDSEGTRTAQCGNNKTVPFEHFTRLKLDSDEAKPGDVLVQGWRMGEAFRDYACVMDYPDKLPIDFDGSSMTDVKPCSHPDFRERIRWQACGEMHKRGEIELTVPDEYRSQPNPLTINAETCADVGLGTDREQEWLEATFPDFDWSRIPE